MDASSSEPVSTSAIYEVSQGEAPPVDASDDEKGMYSFARYTAQDDHYAGFYQSWTKTILFLLSKQWLRWLGDARRYTTDTDVPPWRQQPVTNIVFAIYRTLAAKLLKQKPTLEVVPPSGDSKDREAARLGEAILVHLWRLLKKPAKLKRGIGWFLACGVVYLRTYWDPEAGKLVPRTVKVEQPDPEQPDETRDVDVAADEDGNPYPDQAREPDVVAEGEIAFAIEDPFSVRLNPEAVDEEDADEMFVGKLWGRKRAAKHFGLKESDLESGGDTDRQFFANLLSSAAAGAAWLGQQLSFGSQVGASQEQAIGSQVLVVEYYRKQCRDYPTGRHWISVGTKKVWPTKGEKELPNGFWPPLVPVLSTPIPGQPQALGTLGQVVPLNESLNTLDGKILEYEVLMSMGGKWITHPEDKNLEITSDPGQNMASAGYALGHPPIQSKLVALPGEVYAERAVIMDKVRTVLSLSQAEMGQKPEGVSAGRAFLVLQEVTDSVMGPDLTAWELAMEEIGRRELVLAQKFYREERSIAIRGDRGKWEIRSFQGSDLADGLDVRVQQGSSFPWSKSAQWDIKLETLSKFPGMVTDPQTGAVDQEKFAQFLDTSGTGLASFETDQDPDLVEIAREHAMFEAFDASMDPGEALPQIAFWQDHPAHLAGHARFMKVDYDRFKRWSPEAQAAFVEHLKVTVQAVDEIAGQAAGAVPLAGGDEETAQPGASPRPGGGPPLGIVHGGASGAPKNQRPSLQTADFAAAGQ